MNQSDFAQLESAFEQASDLPPQERADFLNSLMAAQPHVAVHAQSLLNAPDSGVGDAINAMLRRAEREVNSDEVRIQGCSILGVIGEGGFGVVYLAEQAAPIRRFVAVKVIKPGMDSAAVLARFDAERQALALMDHPAVAGALDAGLTHDGRPYVIMPLVPGLPITGFCREQALDLRARLALMAEVCRAVAHAHSKGVIHRDLKPANILVSLADGVPTPRIIDFGLARAIATPLTTHTTLTLDGQLVGTPEYMSPEQAAGLPLDTRSDVYAIGAVLFELIAGHPPHTTEELRSNGADGVRRVLIEVVPRPPSAFAQEHVPREVDWIVLKCLEKDPARRYATVSDLAEDMEAAVGGGAVRAGPPARLYRWWRWSVRHRAGVAAGLLVVSSILAGAGVSAAFALRERDARHQQAEAAAFIKEIFTGLDPAVAQGRDRGLMMDVLARAEARYRAVSWSPESDFELASALASAYRSIGASAKADPHLVHAIDTGLRLWGDTDPRVIIAQGQWLDNQVLLNSAERSWTVHGPEAVSIAARAERYLHRDSRECFETALACARPFEYQSRDDSIRRLKELQQRAEAVLGPSDRLTLRIMRQLGTVYDSQHEEGLTVLQDARARATAAYGPDDPAVHVALGSEMNHISHVMSPAAMIDYFNRHIGPARRVLGFNSPTVLVATYNVANALLQEGRAAEADAYAAESVAIARQQHGDGTVWIEWTLSNHMAIRLALGDIEGATVMERELEQRRDKMQKGENHDLLAFRPETAVRFVKEFRRLGMPERAKPYEERLEKHNPVEYKQLLADLAVQDVAPQPPN